MIHPRELFTRHRLRCTRQRLALYETLRECKSHPTADDLFRLAQPRLGALSRATVYNTLEALCTAGLARRMPSANGCCRYDADTSEHVHVRLNDTSEVCDVPADLGRRLLRSMPRQMVAEIESRMGVKIDGMSIQLHGRRANGHGP